jgi:hypothetical protein
MAFTNVAACRLAEPPEAARCLEGLVGFVTSAAAPIATGWSDQLSGRESHPLEIRAFFTAHCYGKAVFADRYERGSILVTSNLPFSE